MIYLKNNTETQAIYIPRQTVLGGGYIPTTEKYEEAYNNGLEDGKEQQKSKLESINITENGQYEREDGWNVVTVDVHTEGGDAYNTIADIYGLPSDSTVTFKGLVALSFEYGNGYNILFTDHTGSIVLKKCQVPLMVGDECLVTATLGRNAITYISALSNASIEVLSNNNYVVMPTDAVELTNLDGLYMPNANGYAEMKYLYADGTVVSTTFRNNFMRIETDATRPGSIALRGDFSNWEGKLVEGDNIRVYMFPENNTKYFWVTDIIKLGAEGGSCNLQDKWVTPSMSDRDGNNLIVVEESEGYDGLSRVVIDPQTLYNEGVEAGRAEGGEGGSCNLGVLDWTLTSQSTEVKNASDDGYDGYSQVIVRPENIIAQEKENAINDFKNKMDEITITQNGTYGIDDQERLNSITFDGNSYFDTGIVPTENIKIEACIKITNGNNSGAGGIIIGGGIDPVNNGTENRGIAIGMGGGAIYGVWGTVKSWNNPYKYEGEGTTTVTLQKTNDSWGWETEKGSFGASTLYIGGYNRNGEGVEEKFLQSIVYIKIWTNKDDDSTMTLFKPKNMAQGAFGVVNSEGVENSHIENLGSGIATFVEENVKKYPKGFKRVEVNVPDLNGSYDEGKTDGINEQKSKLETINITENGTYNREDGYKKIIVKVPDLNGSYNEGYEQGQADIATNAIVLNVTENGVYKTKFSDPIMPTLVTGVYADGTDFYNYAELGNKVYNTNITVTKDSVVELWYKGDNKKTNDGWNTIFGCAKNDDDDFYLGYMYSDNTNLRGWIGQKQVRFSWDDNIWHHIIMKNDGLWVDDVLMGSFNTTKTFAYNLGLNGTWDSLTRNANGCYGMIKIDNTIIIPTADGFLNTNTGELLEVVKDGTYTFTENLPIYAEGELYKTINVNVPSVQEQITDYYYCPITITDSGFGDRAKSFLVKNENMYGENGWINDDSFVYLPTANNMNEVRTKTPPSSVASFPFDDNAAHYTGALYMNVEQIQMNNVVLPNLYKLELGSGCHTLRMESSNLPNINTLIIRYNGQELFDYHFNLTQFKNGGKLYVYEGLGNAENLRAALGSEWTIEYL